MYVFLSLCCFFFKQKTAYEVRISDWSSDVCSSDLLALSRGPRHAAHGANEKVQERQVLRAFPCAVQRPSDGFVDDISRLDANPDRISYGCTFQAQQVGRR